MKMKRAKIELTPLGNKLKFRVQGKVICKNEGVIRKSLTIDRTDQVSISIFGSQRKVDAFLKKNRKINKVVDMVSALHYSSCDRIF